MKLVGRAKLCPACRACLQARVGVELDTGATYLWWVCPNGHDQGAYVELPASLAGRVWL